VFLNTKSGLPHVSDFVVRDRFFQSSPEYGQGSLSGAWPVPAYLCQSVADYGCCVN
jgi:hypothetical protein